VSQQVGGRERGRESERKSVKVKQAVAVVGKERERETCSEKCV